MMCSGEDNISKLIRVAALTDHHYTPSSRFRIRQLIPAMIANGVAITDMPRKYSTELSGKLVPGLRIRSSTKKMSLALGYEVLNLAHTLSRIIKSRSFDAALVSRELIVGYPTFEVLVNKAFFYDIDDAIFLRCPLRKRGIVNLIKQAKYVFAGNQYLADYCSQFSRNVLIVPTSVNTERFVPPLIKKSFNKFVVGWSGTSSSFGYITLIESELLHFFRSHPNSILRICADRFPSELSSLTKYIEFQKWTSHDEVRQIQGFHIGIMPLAHSEWAKGKCSYKMLLYLSCGVPTITSSFGMNKDVLSLGRIGIGCESVDVWADALSYVYHKRFSLHDIFPDCRRIIEENFSIDMVSQIVSSAIKEVCT